MSDPIVLGVDGGATKTVCVALNNDRQVVGEGRSGSSNPHSVGEEVARSNLRAAIDGALESANRPAAAVAAICAGVAGIDRPGERTLVTGWLADVLPTAKVEVQNDALVALASGTGGEFFGVVAISGTGMIVYGVNRAGTRRRAGGWGALLDAHGSGYAMGIAALQRVARAADGIDPPTTLTDGLLSQLALSAPQQLIPWAYADLTWARFADLAPVVVHCAETGDEAAVAIIEQTAAALAAAVTAVVRGLQLDEGSFPLVLAGGNLQHASIRARLVRHLSGVAPHATVVTPAVSPAVGAALRALHLHDFA
jgi:N-acetylglucosamine kinase-like BadF-type ATPase